MNKKLESFLHWLPKVLTIIFILFLAMLSADIFDSQLGFWDTILGLFMHNIPVLFLVVTLILAWRKPIIGAVVFPLMAIIYIAWALSNEIGMWAFNPVPLFAILLGVLFWVSHKRSKYYWETRQSIISLEFFKSRFCDLSKVTSYLIAVVSFFYQDSL